MILIDANVLIDLMVADPVWAPWSYGALTRAAEHDEIGINPLIYAEVTADEPTQTRFDAAFPPTRIARLPLPYEAAFVSGQAFKLYRRRGGARRAPLPGFYIGAHAAVGGMPLVTRDAARYRGYFPSLDIVAPDSHP